MTPLVVLFIFILIVLFVWWALMRNAREYEPDFEVHAGAHQHDETGAHTEHGAAADAAQPPVAEPAPVEAALVEAVVVDEGARELAPAAVEEEALGFASPEFAAAAEAGSRGLEPATPLAEGEPLGFASPELAVASGMEAARDLSQPDDLVILEGIGPKVAQVLKDAGITTFGQLAQSDPAHLRQVLNAAGLRMLDPGSWPEQAQLAAEGKFQELEELTARLRGGRRVE